MCNEIVGVNGDEGTPVPIPNTVVKLVYGDNTWLATAREDNSTPTSKAATKVAAFCFNHFSCELEVKLGVRGSVRTGRAYPEFCITTKMRCKIELIFQGGSGVGCARLVYNITPTGAKVKGHPRPLESRRRRSAP